MARFSASVWKEDTWYVAQCLEIDVASQGETEAEAIENLGEAIRLHLQPPAASVAPSLIQLEVETGAA